MSENKIFSVLFLAAGTADDYKLSGKFRVYNYVPYFKKRRCRVTVIAWNSEFKDLATSIKTLNRHRLFRSDTFTKMWRFSHLLLFSPFFDIVVIQRTRLPKMLLRILKILNKNIVYDFDDALFVPFSGLGISEWSESNKGKIEQKFYSMLPFYKLVIAGNSYLAEKVRTINPNVVVIPTPVDTTQFTICEGKSRESTFIIGWAGAGEQHIEHLRILLDPLRNISKKYPVIIRIIGAMGSKKIRDLFSENEHFTSDIIDYVPQETFIDEIKKFSIGVMPLVDDEWSRGKCGYKALLYMACGIPTIASPVGVNQDIIQHGETGLLASTSDEWFESIEMLIANPEKRSQIGLKGKEVIEKRFSQTVCEKKLYDSLASIK